MSECWINVKCCPCAELMLNDYLNVILILNGSLNVESMLNYYVSMLNQC